MRKQGGGNRIISGGVQNRFWGGVLWYVFPSPEFFPPFCFSLKAPFDNPEFFTFSCLRTVRLHCKAFGLVRLAVDKELVDPRSSEVLLVFPTSHV